MFIRNKRRSKRRGSALLVALIATMVLASMAGAMLAVGAASKQEHVAAAEHMKALYVAEAGLNEGIAAITNNAAPNLGTADVPITFSNGSYWGTVVTDEVADTSTVTSFGTSRGVTRAVEAVLQRTNDGIFASALFAGNSNGDPTYDLKFGGKGAQADNVTGNVYSGGNILMKDDAKITGTARATGTISGTGAGDEVSGVEQPIPDLVGMEYATHNDVDVAKIFSTSGTYKDRSTTYGGKAWEVPQTSPASIFRKNPSDRTTDTSKTSKDDYFLEDVGETVSGSSTVDWAHGTKITLSGAGGRPGANGNNLVYYIDGNLWVHNPNIFSFSLYNPGSEPIKLTIVVNGNIYISDNIYYENANQDGLALIAMKDKAVTDSGNIYFGDPTFGTLEYMSAFMYAENNFYDSNLNAAGSARVTVQGNMTAGNQVKINRDFGTQHSKLTVLYDSRIWDGSLTLPGLPGQSGADPTWVVASWREVAAQ
jgi:hypothetical protein